MTVHTKLLNREYISLFIINLVVAISFSMITAAMPLYLTQIGVETAVTGTVIGALSIASLCMRPFSGMISDRMRRRRLLQGSLVCISVAVAGYSLTDQVPVLMALRILHGLGFSIATTVTMALVAGTVPASRLTQGMGYFAIGQTLANAVAPSMGMYIGELLGYNVCFLAAACLLICAVVLSYAFVTPSPKPERGEKHGFHLSDFLAQEALPFCMLSIVVAGSTGVENGFVALMGKEAGLGMIGWYFTVSAVALFLSRLYIGRIADRQPLLVICAGTASIALAFLILGLYRRVTSVAMPAFVLAAVLKALGLGAVQPALQSASLRSVGQQRRGAASCTYYLGTDIGQALGPMFGGALAGACGYANMFAIASLPLLIGAILFALYVTMKKKRSGHNVLSTAAARNA